MTEPSSITPITALYIACRLLKQQEKTVDGLLVKLKNVLLYY